MPFKFIFISIIATIPAIAAIIYYKRSHASFRPFLIYTWVAAFNETLGLFCMVVFRTNAVNSNIYGLAEGLLLLWLFRRWGRLNHRFFNFTIIGAIYLSIWLFDNLILNNIYYFNSIHRIVYSLIIVFLSLHQINFIIVRERKNLLKNAAFLICTGFILLFTYKATIEVFYMFRLEMITLFPGRLFILVYRNLTTLCHIIFTIAILWIPKRLKFTLPY